MFYDKTLWIRILIKATLFFECTSQTNRKNNELASYYRAQERKRGRSLFAWLRFCMCVLYFGFTFCKYCTSEICLFPDIISSLFVCLFFACFIHLQLNFYCLQNEIGIDKYANHYFFSTPTHAGDFRVYMCLYR